MSGKKVWVYDDDRTNEDVADVASAHPAFRAAAELVLGEIRAAAAGHVETGRLSASIRLAKGDVDYRIESDGVNYSWHTEFGHMQSGDHGDSWTWVPGIGVFRGVVARHGGF